MLRAGRIGSVGVVRRPVARAAVVTRAVNPGPAPVAKAAVMGAAVTPGRRRFQSGMFTPVGSRPAGITTVGVLVWISGAINLITGFLLILQTGNDDIVLKFGGSAILIVFAVQVMIVGLVLLIVAGGILRGSNGARVVEVVFQVVSIVAAIWLSVSAPAFLWAAVVSIVVSLAVILLLFSGRANALFRA